MTRLEAAERDIASYVEATERLTLALLRLGSHEPMTSGSPTAFDADSCARRDFARQAVADKWRAL